MFPPLKPSNAYASPLLLWAISLGVPLLAWLYCPFLYHSGDDAFVLYTLSGQMGLPPQAWMDYDWGWHYGLGKLLAAGYESFPSINWYPLLLATMQWLSGHLLLRWACRLFPFWTGLGFWLLYFAAFLLFGWVHLSFSGVTLQLGVAASLWLMPLPGQAGRRRWWPVALLVVSALIRLHTTVLGAGLAGISLLAFPTKRWVHYSGSMAAAFGLAVALLVQHQLWCAANLPGWQQDLAVRKALYEFYNRPTKPVDSVPLLLPTRSHMLQYQYSFFLDSSRFSAGRLRQIADRLHSERAYDDPRAQKQTYWLLQNHKWPLLVFVFMATLLLVQPGWKPKAMAGLVLAICLGLLHYLFIYLKLTTVILTGVCGAGSAALLMCKSRYPLAFARELAWGCVAVGITLVAVRLYRFREQNLAQNQLFHCAYDALPKDRWVMATTNHFPVDYMRLTEHPRSYPLPRFFAPAQSSLQHRQAFYAKTPLAAAVLDNNILLYGKDLALPAYLKRKTGQAYQKVWIGDSTTCAPLWQLRPSP